MMPTINRHLTLPEIEALTGETRLMLLTWMRGGSFPNLDVKASLEADPSGEALLCGG
jgi:hypothetical protein